MRERLKREIRVFQMLGPQSRALLLCSQLFRFAGPFVGLFLNLYLWRQTNDLRTLILYNFCVFAGLPLGFIVNGLILRKVSVNLLFPIGFLSQVIFPLLIVLLRQSVFAFIAPLGIISGFGAAFYWANVNYLTYRLNNDENRGYFVGLDNSIGSLIGTVAPVLAGFVVSVASDGYYLSFLTAVGIFVVGAAVAKKYINSLKQVIKFDLRNIVVGDGGLNWPKARALIFLWGAISGATLFTSSVLALEFFRKEFEVGVFNGAAAAVGIFAAYLAARFATPSRRLKTAAFGAAVLVVGSLAFGIAPVLIGYLIFILFSEIGGFFVWTVDYGFIMREIDRGSLSLEEKYHYVVDNEVFINLGRVVGLLLFLLLLQSFNPHDTFRIIIVLSSLLWLANLWVVRKLSKTSG